MINRKIEMINITFPDGSVKQFEAGVTPLEIAQSLSSQLARDVLAASVNDQEWDLTRPTTETLPSNSSNGKTMKANMRSGTVPPTFWLKLSRSSSPE